MFGHSIASLATLAQPEEDGGVRVVVKGDDQEGVQERQEA